MARKKPKQPHPVKSMAQADAALAEIGDLNRRLSAIENRMNEAIDAAKATAAKEAAPHKVRMTQLEGGLEAFADYHKDKLFSERRSADLPHGALGFRKSTEIKTKPKHTWKMVLDSIKKFKFSSAIRTKEEVNKEILSNWPDERLDLVGARRVPKDEFWYEVKTESIEEAANG